MLTSIATTTLSLQPPLATTTVEPFPALNRVAKRPKETRDEDNLPRTNVTKVSFNMVWSQ